MATSYRRVSVLLYLYHPTIRIQRLFWKKKSCKKKYVKNLELINKDKKKRNTLYKTEVSSCHFQQKRWIFQQEVCQLDARILGNPYYCLTIVQSIKLLLTVYRVPVGSAMAVGSHV